jgi:hypothetical protein
VAFETEAAEVPPTSFHVRPQRCNSGISTGRLAIRRRRVPFWLKSDNTGHFTERTEVAAHVLYSAHLSVKSRGSPDDRKNARYGAALRKATGCLRDVHVMLPECVEREDTCT